RLQGCRVQSGQPSPQPGQDGDHDPAAAIEGDSRPEAAGQSDQDTESEQNGAREDVDSPVPPPPEAPGQLRPTQEWTRQQQRQSQNPQKLVVGTVEGALEERGKRRQREARDGGDETDDQTEEIAIAFQPSAPGRTQ